MDGGARFLCEDHPIRRGHRRTVQQFLLIQIGQGLISGRADGSKRNPAPGPVHRRMDVAKMDVVDAVAVLCQKLGQWSAVFWHEGDLVFGRQAKGHGIVMHEQSRTGAV